MRRARSSPICLATLADEVAAIADYSRNDWLLRRKAYGCAEPVVDHAHIRASRLRIEARRWLLVKRMQRIYSLRPGPHALAALRSTLAKLLAEIDGQSRGLR
jgi:hypothetical protein